LKKYYSKIGNSSAATVFLNIILVYKVFVTEKGIFRSCGEIKGGTFKKWFSFDDFLQEVDENSEKRTILVENLVENR
jgi:hypothetical protein